MIESMQQIGIYQEDRMLSREGFDLWADGYDQAVGLSDEENSYPFAGYKDVLGGISRSL